VDQAEGDRPHTKGQPLRRQEAQHGEDRDGVDDGKPAKPVLERAVYAGHIDERAQNGEYPQDEREHALAQALGIEDQCAREAVSHSPSPNGRRLRRGATYTACHCDSRTGSGAYSMARRVPIYRSALRGLSVDLPCTSKRLSGVEMQR
jgi:hypothetical protein